MRPTFFLPRSAALLALAGMVCHAVPASAQTPGLALVEANVSPLTMHYTASADHKNVWLLGLSDIREDGTVVSGAMFGNSFGQASVTVQYGQRYLNPFHFERWYWQWTVGPVYGYVSPDNRKVPLNYKGLSPVFIPSAGYQWTDRLSVQFTLLGNSALMLQLAYSLPDH